jgi:SH3-like domain-containing protein
MKTGHRRICATLFIALLAAILSVNAAAAERRAVKASIANVRSGPGTRHAILWKVEKYFPLQIVKKSGKWYRFVDFEGDRGWIHGGLTNKTPSVVVKKGKCNIRSGPGLKNPVVFTAERGVPFRVLERSGKWIRVKHADGDKGWIYKSLVW